MAGGGSPPAQPSTTTQITDVPEWERGYMQNLLGQAQTISQQPYQQFPGPQIAGFTPDQLSAFQNVEGLSGRTAPIQNAATGTAMQGAGSAGSIYGAGAPDVQASTSYNPLAAVSPYLAQAGQYNSAAAGQPWLGQAAGYQAMAANAATPQGIQSYMSPYTNSVVQGIQDEANQNWNQNIMPGINDSFIGSGNFGSGRNAQVLGRAAGNFQTGLSSNVANALQSGYGMAGQQAAAQGQLLGSLGAQSLTGANTAGGLQSQQVGNILNTAQGAGTATNQQAQNLLNAGTTLGNLASTQAGQQTAAAQGLGNLAQQQSTMDIAQQQALQAVGQQQQQLNQTNLDVAQQNWQNQVNWPKEQTEYLNQIIRGLPTPSSTTASSQSTPAYSVSPLAGLGGSAAAALGLLTNKKKGGLIKGYADGGVVDEDMSDEISTPLDAGDDSKVAMYKAAMEDADDNTDVAPNPLMDTQKQNTAPPAAQAEQPFPSPLQPANADKQPGDTSSALSQQQQLLALARGLLTPSYGGSMAASLGQGLGAVQDSQLAQQKLNAQKQYRDEQLAVAKQRADDMGQYHKDMIGLKQAAANPVAAANSNLTGDEYLKTLPALRAANAKAAAEGRLALTPYLLKTPYGQQLLTDTMQYDPSYDAANSATRVATRKDFTSGKSAQSITALNTAISHLDKLSTDYEKLKNSDFPTYNTAANWLGIKLGNKDIQTNTTNVSTDSEAVSHELAKVFRSTGMSEAEIKAWKEKIDTAATPAQSKAVVDSALELMNGRLSALGQQYNQGMKTSKEPIELLSPDAQKKYQRLMGLGSDEKIQDISNVKPKILDNDKTAAASARAQKIREKLAALNAAGDASVP